MRIGDFLIWERDKDGGPESKVDGLWIFRHKKLFTIAVLSFAKGSREAAHSHAFNSISWLLSGGLDEYVVETIDELGVWTVKETYKPSIKPIITTRDRMHTVYGEAEINKVLTLRGPWVDTWKEIVGNKLITLTHNRVKVSEEVPHAR